jgi:protein-tyrosine-phosphatase/DNA-binding transcriptional ArsR family regulator
MRAPCSEPPPFLRLLAHPHRWQLVSELAESDLRVQELVARLGEPANLVSYHLRRLRHEALVGERRSSADARDVYYTLDLDRLAALFSDAGRKLHPALERDRGSRQAAPAKRRMPPRVLFVCTRNSARSQIAEGLLRHLSEGRVEVWSAGTGPAETVHPLAVEALAERGIDIQAQRAKDLGEFKGIRFDRVVTVCDRAREACPTFPGDPQLCHWSVPDPAAVPGRIGARRTAFRAAAADLERRIGHLLARLDRSC